MNLLRRRTPSEAEILAIRADALESNAARAGAALGCNYVNSREYEAELIARRRAAGVYGSRWAGRVMLVAAIAAGLVVVAMLALLI